MADYVLSAKITGDSSGFEKAFSTAQKSVNSFETKMQSTISKINGVGKTTAGIGTKMSIGITAPVALAGKSMISAASDFEENLNKVDVAFGSSAKEITAWAETATKQFGLSKNQALEATSLFGDMATSMGLTQPEAADMSKSLAGLAGDLASFKNVDIGQAMTALNGVFTGETESLKQLGVVMTETNLEEFAAKTGQVYSQMSQAEKVQLRYNYVMAMTQNAQGDYARTADGTANSMRTFSSATENLGIVLGQQLLPLITPLVQKATELVQRFGEADPKVQTLIMTLIGLAAAIGPVLLIGGNLITSVGSIMKVFSAASTVISNAGGAIGFLTSPIGIAIAAIAAIIAIGYLLISNWDEIKAKAAETWAWVQEKFQAFDNFLTGIFSKDWTESFGAFGEVLNRHFDTVEEVWESVKQVFSGVIDFVAGVFTGDWERAWEGAVNVFGGIWSGLGALVKAPINAVISLVNAAIGGLNSISVDIPDWVPGFGGSTFGLSIPSIPYLLHGTKNWKGGFARMNEGGRGELTYLPNGSQVIPHDISVRYAKESARMNAAAAPLDLSGLMEGMVIQVINNTSVDGTPLREKVSDFVIKKISGSQYSARVAKGNYYVRN